MKSERGRPLGERRQRRVDVVAVQRDQAQDQVRNAAYLGEEVVDKAALAVAVGDEVEVALVQQEEYAAGEQQQPVRPLAAHDLAPCRRLGAAQLAQQQRRRERNRGFASRHGKNEERCRDGPVSAAQVRQQRAEVEERHQ